MTTHVVETANFAIAATYNENRLCAYPRCDVIAVIGHLALMAEIEPCAAKYLGHFLFENHGIGKSRPIYAKDIVIRPVIDQFPCRRHTLSRFPK
jgi:hypothetical protein